MAKLASICFAFLSVLLLLVQCAVSEDPPVKSPAPAPESGVDSPPSISPTPISIPPDASPVNAPSISPPSPVDLAPDSPPPPPSPSTSPSSTPSPSPSPSELNDVNRSDVSKIDDGDSDEGMNGGQKFGIAVGVMAAVALVGFGGLVYKKRRDNVRRSHYGYAARREIL